MRYTKIFENEKRLLKGLSGSAIMVYLHLKDDKTYFCDKCKKGSFYDLQAKIAESLEVSEKTVSRAISDLKSVGLIKITKVGKVNCYELLN